MSRPTYWCFGKVIGGGLPVGAFGGRRDVCRYLAPLGPVYQAGTLSGNPLGHGRWCQVLELVTPDDYVQLSSRVQRFVKNFVGGSVVRLFAMAPVEGPLMGSTCPGESFETPRNFARGESTLRQRSLRSVLSRDARSWVAMAPGAYEILFVSLAHSDDDLARTVEAAASAAKEVANS